MKPRRASRSFFLGRCATSRTWTSRTSSSRWGTTAAQLNRATSSRHRSKPCLPWGGYGERFRTEHHLGRATVQPPAELLAMALPGLDELAPRLAENPELESVGEVLQFLRVLFLQDAALKVKREGAAFAAYFPQLKAVMAHEAWPAFAADVPGPPPGEPQGARGR